MTWFTDMLEASGQLCADRTYFVSANEDPAAGPVGSDANDGRSVDAPLRTVQHAANIISKLNFGPYKVTLKLAGDFSGEWVSIMAMTSNGPSQFVIEGDETNPSAAKVGGLYPSCTHCTIKGVEYVGDGLYGDGGLVVFSHVKAVGQIRAQVRAFIQIAGPVELNGDADAAMQAEAGSVIVTAGGVVTGNGNYAQGFAFARDGGAIVCYTQPAGSATGKRFKAVAGGTINTQGGGATYLPGYAEGDTESGGVYC